MGIGKIISSCYKSISLQELREKVDNYKASKADEAEIEEKEENEEVEEEEKEKAQQEENRRNQDTSVNSTSSNTHTVEKGEDLRSIVEDRMDKLGIKYSDAGLFALLSDCRVTNHLNSNELDEGMVINTAKIDKLIMGKADNYESSDSFERSETIYEMEQNGLMTNPSEYESLLYAKNQEEKAKNLFGEFEEI